MNIVYFSEPDKEKKGSITPWLVGGGLGLAGLATASVLANKKLQRDKTRATAAEAWKHNSMLNGKPVDDPAILSKFLLPLAGDYSYKGRR